MLLTIVELSDLRGDACSTSAEVSRQRKRSDYRVVVNSFTHASCPLTCQTLSQDHASLSELLRNTHTLFPSLRATDFQLEQQHRKLRRCISAELDRTLPFPAKKCRRWQETGGRGEGRPHAADAPIWRKHAWEVSPVSRAFQGASRVPLRELEDRAVVAGLSTLRDSKCPRVR